MSASKLDILALQLDLAWENPMANLDNLSSMLERSKPAPDTLVVVPEMFPSGFSMNAEVVAELDPSPSLEAAGELAISHQIYLLIGIALRADTHSARNMAILIDPNGTRIAEYQKIQPFSYGGEDKSYAAGSEVVIASINGVMIAPFICYDLRFPEWFRQAALQGAEIFPVIANWPAKRTHHWRTLLQARAIENLAGVVGVNRCGADPFHQYAGDSAIVDPMGDVLANAGNGETAIRATFDIDALRAWRSQFPALKDCKL